MNGLDAIAAHKARGGPKLVLQFVWIRAANTLTGLPTIRRSRCGFLPWVNYRYGLTGYLHWGGNFWTDRPFEKRSNLIGAEGSFCPRAITLSCTPTQSTTEVFVSERLEVMPRGVIEDYETVNGICPNMRVNAQTLWPEQ